MLLILNIFLYKVHSATNDIEMMDFEYKEEQENKVSDLHNTGAKGNNTEYVFLMLFASSPQKSRVISPMFYGSRCMAE